MSTRMETTRKHKPLRKVEITTTETKYNINRYRCVHTYTHHNRKTEHSSQMPSRTRIMGVIIRTTSNIHTQALIDRLICTLHTQTNTNRNTHRPAETHAGLLGDSHAENGAVCSDSSHNHFKLTLNHTQKKNIFNLKSFVY